MFCNKCGIEMPEGNKFCNGCGASQSETGVIDVEVTPVHTQEVDPATPPPKASYSLEKILVGGVDVLAAILYIYIIWQIFFNDNPELAMTSWGEWLGVFFVFVVIVFIVKIVKSIVGSIGRAFDRSMGN